MSERAFEYECESCGEEIKVPPDTEINQIGDWLEEQGWSRTGPEDDGQWLCPDCNATSLAGEENEE